MFFNDNGKPCVIFYKLLYPQFGECVGRCKRPLASWAGPEASGDTAGTLGNAFDRQAPLMRPREAVRAACSTFTTSKTNAEWTTWGADPDSEIFGNLKKSPISKVLWFA